MRPEDIDWNNLKFGYTRTPINVRCYWRDGEWGPIEEHTEETVTMHMAATAFHYGQTAFEGLKAYRCRDGRVRIFRMDENARRLQSSAAYLQMAVPSVELFCDMVTRVVEANKEYIPAYETGGSLYIRPVIVGSGPQLGVKPADETLLLMFVSPVGPYYSGGMKGISAIIDRTHDRAAPFGTGHIKAGGNYGASLTSALEGHEKGYDSVLYLDPAHHRYIDECGAANFFGVRVDERGVAHYITPDSHSILPSITNKGVSKICPTLLDGAGVVTTRNHIHWFVTEYGAVDLYGKSMQERARLLISVAHPSAQEELDRAAFERWGSHHHYIKSYMGK